MNITEIATAILPSVMEIIGTIAMIMAAKIGIPWLREQRIFSLVRKLVKGAEKAAEAGKIPKTDKHALVIKLLKIYFFCVILNHIKSCDNQYFYRQFFPIYFI